MVKKFNKEYIKYLFPQRTRLTTEYKLTTESDTHTLCKQISLMVKKDYDMIKYFLPEKTTKILDIGCGLGLIDLSLYKHYIKTELHLLDKSQDLDENTSIRGFNGNKYTFYNSLEASKEILISNGVEKKDIYTYEVGDHLNLFNNKYDVIISLLSCGWHYSIELYKDLIQKTLNSNGVLILDIRHNTGQLEYAKEYFDLIDKVINKAERMRRYLLSARKTS